MNEDGIPSFKHRPIETNWHKISRPYETPVVNEYFIFSYGKLLEDVTLSEDIKYLNDFDWLQQLLTMKYRVAGYTLYSSPKPMVYRRKEQQYCVKDYLDDWQAFRRPYNFEQYMMRREIEDHRSVEKNALLRKILSNKHYLNYMTDKWEIDIEQKRYTRKGMHGGIDGDHFYKPVECTFYCNDKY